MRAIVESVIWILVSERRPGIPALPAGGSHLVGHNSHSPGLLPGRKRPVDLLPALTTLAENNPPLAHTVR